jgi:hypothetical protein
MANQKHARYHIGAVLLTAALIACAGDATDTLVHLPKKADVCIEGCQDPPVVMTLVANLGYGGAISGDSVYLPDSSYSSQQASLEVSIGDTTANEVSVGFSIGSSCSNGCIFPTTSSEPISPSDVLTLDPHSTYDYEYYTWQTLSPGTGTLYMSAGATVLTVPVVVNHCVYRLSCSH